MEMTNNDYSSFFTSHQMQTPSPGATVEVAKKPKGRPKGSKNKPKEAARLLVPRDGGDVMAPYILEVLNGNDIVRAISQFSISKNIGLCVLTASGTIANASLRPSSAASAPGISCSGHHAILSMSATFAPHQYPTAGYAPKPLTVSLATPNGHVIGGSVLGSLVSAGSVYVIATSFNGPSYYILSHEDEESVRNTAAAGGETGYAPSHLPGGIPVYRDNLTAVHGLCPPVIRSSQPAPSTPQYLT